MNEEGALKSFAGSSFQKMASLLDLGGEALLVGQGKLVFASKNLVRQSLERVPRDRVVLFRAQNQSDWWVLVRLCPMFAGIVQVEMHLTGIGVRELPNLQIDDDEASQFAVKEKEIDAIPFATNPQPALTTDESEVASKFEQETFQMPQERFLKIGLGIFVFQPEEFENERVAHFFIGGDGIFGLRSRALAQHGFFVS